MPTTKQDPNPTPAELADADTWCDVIDAMCQAGMIPADEYADAGMPITSASRQWVADRWDAVAQATPTVLVVARHDPDEGRIVWQVTTRTGVIYDEGSFHDNAMGRAMFTAVVVAVGGAA